MWTSQYPSKSASSPKAKPLYIYLWVLLRTTSSTATPLWPSQPLEAFPPSLAELMVSPKWLGSLKEGNCSMGQNDHMILPKVNECPRKKGPISKGDGHQENSRVFILPITSDSIVKAGWLGWPLCGVDRPENTDDWISGKHGLFNRPEVPVLCQFWWFKVTIWVQGQQ